METNNLEKNVPGFSNELYKESILPGAKERMILMLLKDHQYNVKRMEQYYHENGNEMATMEEITKLQYRMNNEEDANDEENDTYVDPDGFTRKLQPGEKYSIFLNSENNDRSQPPREKEEEEKEEGMDKRASYLNKLLAEKMKKQKKKKQSPMEEGIKLAPEGNYEEDRRYFHEPKIVPRDQQIKIIFPEEEKAEEILSPEYLQSYLRIKRNAVKGDYIKEYKKYQDAIQQEVVPHPSGVSLYQGAKTFLDHQQIKDLERLQRDSFLNSNKERIKEKAKAKIKFKFPQSLNPPSEDQTMEDNFILDGNTEISSKGGSTITETPKEKEKKKFNINKAIEEAEIRKNNFSLLYTEKDKEYGRKLEKWKKYKYIYGQGNEKGKLLRYSIWRKDIFVQDRRTPDDKDDSGQYRSLIDLQVKKYLLKNKNTSDHEKESIKDSHVDALLQWNEERKHEFVEKWRKERYTLHSYMSRLHCKDKKLKELEEKKEEKMINDLFNDKLYSPSSLLTSSTSPRLPELPKNSNKNSNSSTTINPPSSLEKSSSIHSTTHHKEPTTINSTTNSTTTIFNPQYDLNSNIPPSSFPFDSSKDQVTSHERYEAAKFNSSMRKTKDDPKVNYIRDYCVRKKRLTKADSACPTKDIFADSSSVMDNIKNFTVDRFIHEYKTFIKNKESIWNREGDGFVQNDGQSFHYHHNYKKKLSHEESLEIIRDLVNSTVNSSAHYIRYKFKSNYSGNPSPEYIHYILTLLTEKNGEWNDKELGDIRKFIGGMGSFKGCTKDFIHNVLYNSNVLFYRKNSSFDIKNSSKYYFILCGTIILKYVNTADLHGQSYLSVSGSGRKSQTLDIPKLYGNSYYSRRKSFITSNNHDRDINRAYGLCRRQSNSDTTVKNDVILIKNIGESFNNFEHDANGFELDSVLTSTPAYILVMDKNDYEKYKKMVEEKNKNEKAGFLKKLPIFQNFTFDSLFSFAESVEYRAIPCGQTILSFNQPLEEFYIVKRGKCNVYRRLYLEKDGLMKSLKIYVGQYGPGEYFGERGIIEYHGYLHIKNMEIIDKFLIKSQGEKDIIRSELNVVAIDDLNEKTSIYDDDDTEKSSLKSKSSSPPHHHTNGQENEDKPVHQKKQQQKKNNTIELAVIPLSKARLKLQNMIEYSKYEKLTQDDLYCLYMESDKEKQWNKLKEHFNNERLKELTCDPNFDESKLDEMAGKERWK